MGQDAPADFTSDGAHAQPLIGHQGETAGRKSPTDQSMDTAAVNDALEDTSVTTTEHYFNETAINEGVRYNNNAVLAEGIAPEANEREAVVAEGIAAETSAVTAERVRISSNLDSAPNDQDLEGNEGGNISQTPRKSGKRKGKGVDPADVIAKSQAAGGESSETSEPEAEAAGD